MSLVLKTRVINEEKLYRVIGHNRVRIYLTSP